MTSSNTPNYPVEPSPPAIAEQPSENDDLSSSSSGSKRPWLIALGLLILLIGGGLGWRWWQSIQAAGDPGAAQAQQPMAAPVELATVETATIQETSEFIGNLESRSSVVLKPEIEGRVSQIYVSSGDTVSAGSPLVQLQPDKRQAEFASVLSSVNSARAIRASALSELQALQAERGASAAEVELQQEQYRRTQSLVEQDVLAAQELDVAERDVRAAIANLNATDQRIEASRANLAEASAALQQAQANAALAGEELQDTTIVSPFAGVVGDIPVKIGDFVNIGDTLTSVTQSQSLDLRLSVPAERKPDLRQGLQVILTDSNSNSLGTGQISFVSPQVDANAQSILAKATFPNPGGQLLDGQSVRARIVWNQRPGILIPTTAISRLGGQNFVFVAVRPEPSEAPSGQAGQPQLIAEQRAVTLGDIQDNQYQVLEGLEAGESIVVSGIINLSDGVPITTAPPGPAPGGPPQ